MDPDDDGSDFDGNLIIDVGHDGEGGIDDGDDGGTVEAGGEEDDQDDGPGDQDFDWSVHSVFTQLACGLYHTCALTCNGKVYCWGADDQGQLGNGVSIGSSSLPVTVDTSALAGEKTFIQITTGGEHTCALTSGGRVFCWGSNQVGQLGDGGGVNNSHLPVAIDLSNITGEKSFKYISARGRHTCGITGQGDLYCWGNDTYDQLGNGSGANSSPRPMAVDVNNVVGDASFIQVACGSEHTCALSVQGVAYCWGRDNRGQAGNNNGAEVLGVPMAVDTSTITEEKEFVQIAAGGETTCAVTAQGYSYCWGRNDNGEVGNGTLTEGEYTPQKVDTNVISGEQAAIQITVNTYHSCLLTSEGKSFCWGLDADGLLGNGETLGDSSRPSPLDLQQVRGYQSFKQIAAGWYHTCGLTSEGEAYCWGLDDQGQLGDGEPKENKQHPVRVEASAITTRQLFIEIEAAQYHSCAINTAGKPYCWGLNLDGQVGDNSQENREIPVEVDLADVGNVKSFKKIAAGYISSCGLASDGRIYCWGSDAIGQLGNGDALGQSLVPRPIDVSNIPAGETSFVDVSAGFYHACGVTARGRAYCWGRDKFGTLGDSDGRSDTQVAVAVDTSNLPSQSKSIKQIVVSEWNTCLLTASGKVFCFGQDTSNQIGEGPDTADKYIPVEIDSANFSVGDTAMIDIDAGYLFACALSGKGVVYCWGDDEQGVLGDGPDRNDSAVPVPIVSDAIGVDKAFVKLTTRHKHVCGINTQGIVHCWGSDLWMQIGDQLVAGTAPYPTLVYSEPLGGDKHIRKVSAGSYHTCIISSMGIPYCWGWDEFGGLGEGPDRNDSQTALEVDLSGI
jgi:alpha-tubulin suppressor-like RCC1 family protein